MKNIKTVEVVKGKDLEIGDEFYWDDKKWKITSDNTANRFKVAILLGVNYSNKFFVDYDGVYFVNSVKNT